MNTIVSLPLAGAVATIALAMPLNAGWGAIDPAIAAAAAAIDAWQKLEATLEPVAFADEAMFKWLHRNPRPEIRAIVVGSNADYAAFEAGESSYDPNADLRAAIKEHEVVLREWGQRKRVAEMQSGLVRAQTKEKQMGENYNHLAKKLRMTRPTSLNGLVAKARAIRYVGIDPMMNFQLVDDVVDMFEGTVGDKLPGLVV